MRYTANNDYRNYLAHYGVKGMKWGVHKTSISSSADVILRPNEVGGGTQIGPSQEVTPNTRWKIGTDTTTKLYPVPGNPKPDKNNHDRYRVKIGNGTVLDVHDYRKHTRKDPYLDAIKARETAKAIARGMAAITRFAFFGLAGTLVSALKKR